MNKDVQKEEWENFSQHITVEEIIANVKSPALFQKEFAEYINEHIEHSATAIEVGCEMGITSFLLKCKKRIFLDFDSSIINKVKKAHATLSAENTKDEFIVGDMFHMSLPDSTVDVCFNSGVLEHYSSSEIVKALAEMKRVTSPDGLIVVGIPNHYCIVYRLAYLRGQLLDKLHIRKWSWPKEIKYYDLLEEIQAAGLCLIERKTMSKGSIYNWWGG